MRIITCLLILTAICLLGADHPDMGLFLWSKLIGLAVLFCGGSMALWAHKKTKEGNANVSRLS